jgi:NAD(P)-dependent dehydrogenase (short-subunit alcohol dehydrogenase family)
MPSALVIGGTSGLGRELALKLSTSFSVTVTGRRDPALAGVLFFPLELAADAGLVGAKFDELLSRQGGVDLLVYAAGFRQEGLLDDLTDADIREMELVSVTAPAMLIKRILKRQAALPELVVITSTSQWTPRVMEPMYTAAKAGLGMLTASLSLDSRIARVLLVGPGGMVTRFWEGSGRDVSSMLDPVWVADEIMKLREGSFRYRFVRIPRNPPRVEIAEER